MSYAQLSQLNQELQFIEENDEFADIAAGDRVIDESLIDEVLDNADTSAEATQAETSSSEAKPFSVLSMQLLHVKERLLHEIATHGRPLCYLRGDFYDRPAHPVFALQHGMETSGLDATKLYWRDVFVWLPYLLPGCPDTFKCQCTKPLKRKGMYN